MRVAAIDLGTNTTRLLVADVDDGRLERSTGGRTSRGSAKASTRDAVSSPIRSHASATCSSDYRRTRESLGAERTLVVATSAVRDADNGEAFLGEIEWSYGFATRLATATRRRS